MPSFEARDALPPDVRKAAFERYVDDPYDGAAPSAIVAALARLKRGELLSPGSTALSARHHEPHQDRREPPEGRPRAGLGTQPQNRHRPGARRRSQAGYNDIGILTAPDGRSYAVAVMIKLTSVPLPVRMELMNNVVRAVIAQHDMQYAPAAQQ